MMLNHNIKEVKKLPWKSWKIFTLLLLLGIAMWGVMTYALDTTPSLTFRSDDTQLNISIYVNLSNVSVKIPNNLIKLTNFTMNKKIYNNYTTPITIPNGSLSVYFRLHSNKLFIRDDARNIIYFEDLYFDYNDLRNISQTYVNIYQFADYTDVVLKFNRGFPSGTLIEIDPIVANNTANNFVHHGMCYGNDCLFVGFNRSGVSATGYIYNDNPANLRVDYLRNFTDPTGESILAVKGKGFNHVFYKNGTDLNIGNFTNGNITNRQVIDSQCGSCTQFDFTIWNSSGSSSIVNETAWVVLINGTSEDRLRLTFYNHTSESWTTRKDISSRNAAWRTPAIVNFKNYSLWVFGDVNNGTIYSINSTDGVIWGNEVDITPVPLTGKGSLTAIPNATSAIFVFWFEPADAETPDYVNATVLIQNTSFVKFEHIVAPAAANVSSDRGYRAIIGENDTLEVFVMAMRTIGGGDFNQTIWMFRQNGNSWTTGEVIYSVANQTLANPRMVVMRNLTHRIIYYETTDPDDTTRDIAMVEKTINIASRPAFSNEKINNSYVVNNTPIRLNLTVAPADVVFAEINGANYTMLNLSSSQYELNFSANSTTDQNITIRFWANNTDFSSPFTSDTATLWLIIDNNQPEIRFSKANTDQRNRPFGIIVHLNATDFLLNYTNITIVLPNGVMHSSFQQLNTTVEINITSSNAVGNYTINITARDYSGNQNTTRVRFDSWIGVGNLNISFSPRFGHANYSTEQTAFGQPGSLVNNTATILNTTMQINLTVDGFCANACSRRVEFNWSARWNNWTRFVIINSTDNTPVITFSAGTLVNYTSSNLTSGWGSSVIDTAEVSSHNGIRFYRHKVGSHFRYTSESNLTGTESFNMYEKITFPDTWATNTHHPRYFVCTSGITLPSDCSIFSTSVDVTSANSGDNSVLDYLVNLKVYKSGTTAESFSIQTNQSNYLLEIQIVTGSFDAGGGNLEQGSGGGSGGGGLLTPLLELLKPPEIKCPIGYKLNLTNNKECYKETPKTEIFKEEITAPIIGPFSIIHIVAFIFAGFIIYAWYKKKNALKTRGFLSR